MLADVVPFAGDETLRQLLTLGGGLVVIFGYAQILWNRQKQAIDEARQLRKATGEDREKAEREVEQARVERRAAEHERRNIEQVANEAKWQLGETSRQLEACRATEIRLRADIDGYRADLDFKGTEIVELRAQVVELRRIIRVRFADHPRRGVDEPEAEFPERDA